MEMRSLICFDKFFTGVIRIEVLLEYAWLKKCKETFALVQTSHSFELQHPLRMVPTMLDCHTEISTNNTKLEAYQTWPKQDALSLGEHNYLAICFMLC